MSKPFNGLFQAAAFIRRAHSLYLGTDNRQAEVFVATAKKIYYEAYNNLSNEEKEEQWNSSLIAFLILRMN